MISKQMQEITFNCNAVWNSESISKFLKKGRREAEHELNYRKKYKKYGTDNVANKQSEKSQWTQVYRKNGVRTICPKSIGPMPTCPILTCPTWQLVLCQLAPQDILSYAVLSHT